MRLKNIATLVDFLLFGSQLLLDLHLLVLNKPSTSLLTEDTEDFQESLDFPLLKKICPPPLSTFMTLDDRPGRVIKMMCHFNNPATTASYNIPFILPHL